jgi:hypothetical protein
MDTSSNQPNALMFILTSLETLKEQVAKTNDLTKLADCYGEIKILIEELETKADVFNKALKDKMAADERVIGNQWTVLKSQPKDRRTLDTKKLEAELGKEKLDTFYTKTPSSPRLTVDHTKAWEVAA